MPKTNLLPLKFGLCPFAHGLREQFLPAPQVDLPVPQTPHSENPEGLEAKVTVLMGTEIGV